MGFELDIKDMERHSVDLRLYLDKAKRRFEKAKMPDQFDTIVATILSQSREAGGLPSSVTDLDTVTIKQVNRANSERLTRFLIHLIEKCNNDPELVLSLQEAIRRSLLECVRRKQPDQPMCFFCSQKFTISHVCNGDEPNGITDEIGMGYGLTDEPIGMEIVPSSQVTPPPDEEQEYTIPPDDVADAQANRPVPSTTPPVDSQTNPKQANGTNGTQAANQDVNHNPATANNSIRNDHTYLPQPEAVLVKKQFHTVRIQVDPSSNNLQQQSQDVQSGVPGEPSPSGTSTSTDTESTASVKKAKQEKTITISLDPAKIKREFIEQSSSRQEKLNQAVASLVIATNNRSSIATTMANESMRGSPSTQQVRRPSAIIMTPEGPARTKQKRTQRRARNKNSNASPR